MRLFSYGSLSYYHFRVEAAIWTRGSSLDSHLLLLVLILIVSPMTCVRWPSILHLKNSCRSFELSVWLSLLTVVLHELLYNSVPILVVVEVMLSRVVCLRSVYVWRVCVVVFLDFLRDSCTTHETFFLAVLGYFLRSEWASVEVLTGV